jgi:uncharacterized membrane protein
MDQGKEVYPISRKILLSSIFLVLVMIWLINSPPGLLGKSDALGYAVCHRIPSHSFFFGDRPFSLCARCTGQYIGFLWGMIAHFVWGGKRNGFPTRKSLILYGLIAFVYLVDGINSILHLYSGLDHWILYEPNNILRLFSGLFLGVSLSNFLYPLMGQSLWRQVSLQRGVNNIIDLSIFFGGGTILGLMVLSQNPIILYPLILFSTGGLLGLLSMLYMMIWIIISKKENSFNSWQEVTWWGIAGISTAFVQIIVIDWVRFALTNTWSGWVLY